jgi:type IV pilus assembly protein PilO
MEQLLEKITKAKPAARWGVLAGAVVLITALNFLMSISPLSDQIAQLVGQQRQLELQLAEKQEIARNLNERRRQMDALEQKLADALTQLPETKDIEDILAQLNDIGRKSGLEISSIEPMPEEVRGFYGRIPMKVQVAGNYHEVALFLQDVANMRRIVNVNNLHLGNPTMRNEKIVLKSDFLATTFRFVDESKAKAAGKSGSHK